LSSRVTATTRTPGKLFAVTNELRSQGTDNLLAAASRAGTRRVIAQSNVNATERSGGPVKTETDPLDSRPIPTAARTLAAIKHVEEAVPLAVPEGHRAALRQLLRAARKELGWEPRYPSWREGFRAWVGG
jgi:hypothetical protein